jgi:hypothetical protein
VLDATLSRHLPETPERTTFTPEAPMTTHQTPPNAATTPEVWRAMVNANNDSAATDPVDWVETTAPHYSPRGRHRWLWHLAIPLGEVRPGGGVQEITARSGTALTQAGAKRKIGRLASRHFAEAAGRDPHGPMLDAVRHWSLFALLVTGVALILMTAGCTPSTLGVLVMVAAIVGIAATLAKSHRAHTRRT